MSTPAAPIAATPLIDAASLRCLIDDRGTTSLDLLLLDCRFNLAQPDAGQAAYLQGHIEGAIYAHLDRDLSGPKTGRNGRHPLPTPQALTLTLQDWGVTPETRIVAYDDAGGMIAARAWWLLRWFGLAHVQVLDGGLPAWIAADGTLTDQPPTRQPSLLAPGACSPADLVSADEVLAGMSGHRGAQVLLDARTPERFRGLGETLDPVGGHIPGARNRWFGLNLKEGGRFKDPTALRQEFDALLGDVPPGHLVHQCGSGVTACHNLLAMAHAGLDASRLYPGSWSEWCADPTRPVSTD